MKRDGTFLVIGTSFKGMAFTRDSIGLPKDLARLTANVDLNHLQVVCGDVASAEEICRINNEKYKTLLKSYGSHVHTLFFDNIWEK